jgi:hypothetical protein
LFCHFPTRLTWLVASYSAGFIAARQKFQSSKDNSVVLTAPQSRSVKKAFGFQFPADATFSNKYQHTQQSMQQHAQAHAAACTSPCNSKHKPMQQQAMNYSQCCCTPSMHASGTNACSRQKQIPCSGYYQPIIVSIS